MFVVVVETAFADRHHTGSLQQRLDVGESTVTGLVGVNARGGPHHTGMGLGDLGGFKGTGHIRADGDHAGHAGGHRGADRGLTGGTGLEVAVLVEPPRLRRWRVCHAWTRGNNEGPLTTASPPG